MSPESTVTAIAFDTPFELRRPASGWSSWAPEVADSAETMAIESDEPVGLYGGVLCLLMWGCASLLAVWYL